MIEFKNGVFGLHGEGFSCLLRINKYGLLELLHFGESLSTEDGEAFFCKPGIGWGSSVPNTSRPAKFCSATYLAARPSNPPPRQRRSRYEHDQGMATEKAP